MAAIISLELINVKPMSTNHMYYSFARKGGKGTFKTKSKDYLDYIRKMHETLDELLITYPETIKLIEEIATQTCPYLEIEVDIPKKSYVTLAGKLKPNDSSNFIKSTEDAIFSYFAEKISPEVKDQQVIKVSSTKRQSETDMWKLLVNIHLPNGNNAVYKITKQFD